MRICLVGPTYPFRGGIAHYNTVLFRELAKRHETFLVSLRKQYPNWLFPGTTQRDESERPIAVDHHPILTPLGPHTWRTAARHIERLRPDLVVIQWWHPFFAPAFGSLARRLKRRGMRVVVLCHNGRAHEASRLDGILTRYAFSGADAFIAHSEGDRAAILETRRDARVVVSPHPSYSCFRMREEATRSEARATLGLPDRETLLFFGYVREYKGLPLLLEAMASIRDRRNVQLLVVGEFYSGRDEADALVARHGLDDRVLFVDRYVANEEVQGYFECADAVVLPYRSASQSGIVQIAYELTRPVIATRVGGLPEVVEDGGTGFLCDPNPGSIEAAIERFFASDPEALAQRIRDYRTRFAWDAMVDVIESLTAESPEHDAERARSTTSSTSRASRRETSSAS